VVGMIAEMSQQILDGANKKPEEQPGGLATDVDSEN